MAELFVPYHQSSRSRFYDLTSFSFPLAEVKAEDAGPFGTLMPPFQGDPYATVVKEMRDRGIAWKDYAHGVRRGRELVIWAGLEAGNYMYISPIRFTTTARSLFASVATGQNLPGQRTEAHVHSAHWRIDLDLVDGNKNSAMLMKHVENPAGLSAEDMKEPFNGGLEGGVDWVPSEFTMIRVESEKKNARGADDCLRSDAGALRLAAAQRAVHASRPLGEQVAPGEADRIPIRQSAQYCQG